MSPAFGQRVLPHPFAPLPFPPERTFMVGARSGLRGSNWPLGRLSISPAGLRVHTTGVFPINVVVSRRAVTSVSIGRGLYGQTLRVTDVEGYLNRVAILVPFRRQSIIVELGRCGYRVWPR